MFLNRLNEVEKKAFLELAHYVARCDGNFMDEQKEIIKQYCNEMQIEDINFKEEKFDIYDVLSKIKNKRSQKIVLLEIMALIYADDYLHEEERKVLEKMFEEFDLNYNLSVIYAQWAKAMLSLYIQGNALIEL